MSLPHSDSTDKCETLVQLATQLEHFVQEAAAKGTDLYTVEKNILEKVLQMGRQATDRFLQLQGDGDLGATVQTAEGTKLQRSDSRVSRPLRTVFGEHTFSAYVYALGPKQRIALRPIDARLNLSAGKWSYLLEEFSQYFCVEQAFGQAANAFQTVLNQQLSVDMLERTNQQLGQQAEAYLNALPTPPADEEGELLVATADGKGVPLIRDDVETPPVHGPKPPRPNNRRMATVASVYSVDPYLRTADDVLAALFRDDRDEREKVARPRPCHKRMTACFPKLEDAGSAQEVRIPGDILAWAWAAEQVDDRRQAHQVLIRLHDGQESLWKASDNCLELALGLGGKEEVGELADVVDILDVIHVTSYVWSAGRALCGNDPASLESFVRNRMLRILQGQAPGVIRGMRRMATERGLRGQCLKDVVTACNYMENNLERMRYDQYLAAGYPISSGVIEGACRHLVKDRMERTGMRWRESSAGEMLFVRALAVTDLWEPFQNHRQAAQRETLHPHRTLLRDYTPTDNIAA